LDVPLLYNIIHALLIFLIVLSYYSLGKKIDKKFCFILPVLIVLFYSLPDWLGLAYMYPSTLVILLFPYLLLNLLDQLQLKVLLWIIISFLVYWQISVIFIAVYILYHLVINKRYLKIIILLSSLLLILIFLRVYGINELVLLFLNYNNIEDEYIIRTYTDNLLNFIILFFIGFFGILNYKKNIELYKILCMFFIVFIIGSIFANILLIRLTILVLLAWYIFCFIGLIYLLEYFSDSNFKIKTYTYFVILLIITIFILNVIANNNNNNFKYEDISLRELEGFNWLKNNSVQTSVLSDPRTINLAYAWSLTNESIKNKLFNQKEKQEFKSKIYSFLEEDNLSEKSIDFLNQLRIEYVIISYRTSEAIYYHMYRADFWQLSSPGKSFLYFNGFEKFNNTACFMKLFDNEEVKIFKYNSSCNL
jgi:hypothetical protein